MIPQKVLLAYVERYPHMRILAARTAAGMVQARLAFAQNATRLEVPRGVTPLDVYHLCGVANGLPWPPDLAVPDLDAEPVAPGGQLPPP